MIPVEKELSFEIAEEVSRLEPVEPGVYEFVVDRIDDSNTSEGRPRWLVLLRIINNPRYGNRVLVYNVVLPWVNPATGQWDVSGIGLLTQLCNGVGKRWIGDLKRDEVKLALKNSLAGATGFMRVGHRTYNDPTTGEKVKANSVRIVTRK
jgi:hypothetical protein